VAKQFQWVTLTELGLSQVLGSCGYGQWWVAPLTAATVLGAAGLAALSGRIICGLLADRMGTKHTLVACLALQAVAIALYLPARDLRTLYVESMLFGFSYGDTRGGVEAALAAGSGTEGPAGGRGQSLVAVA
jgi:predicted MFS family arabinose efflux permease